MDRRETERLVFAIREVQATGARAALATVIRVQGSAYRREGTRMLVREDGTYECALSGGCLEPAVAESARRVIATGDPLIINYDLADDSLWGLGMGCAGAVDIRIERIEDDPLTHEWLASVERGDEAVLATVLAGPARRLLVRRSGEVKGNLGLPDIAADVIEHALARLETPLPQAGIESIGSMDILFEVSGPAPALLIFGAGHDAAPLARLAWSLGFAVTIVDPREAFLTPDRFPGMMLIPAHVHELVDKVTVSARSVVLVMNHHAERDRESLRFVLSGATPEYVGVLGPRARYEKLLAALAADGWAPPPAALARVRNPVGLALGAETPEEVALSIMAEILAMQRGFDGRPLSGTTRSMHRGAGDNSPALASGLRLQASAQPHANSGGQQRSWGDSRVSSGRGRRPVRGQQTDAARKGPSAANASRLKPDA